MTFVVISTVCDRAKEKSDVIFPEENTSAHSPVSSSTALSSVISRLSPLLYGKDTSYVRPISMPDTDCADTLTATYHL